MLDFELRSKVNFDINHTNPQAATGHCKFWITNGDPVKPKPKSLPPLPPPATSIEQTHRLAQHRLHLWYCPNYTPHRWHMHACINDATGKCKGMLTLERLNILYKAFNDVNFAGIWDTTTIPPKSFASEYSDTDLAMTQSGMIANCKKILVKYRVLLQIADDEMQGAWAITMMHTICRTERNGEEGKSLRLLKMTWCHQQESQIHTFLTVRMLHF